MFATTALSILASVAASATALHSRPNPKLPPGIQPIIIVEGLRPGADVTICGEVRTLEAEGRPVRALHNERGVYLVSRTRLSAADRKVLRGAEEGRVACAETNERPRAVEADGVEVEGVQAIRPYAFELAPEGSDATLVPYQVVPLRKAN